MFTKIELLVRNKLTNIFLLVSQFILISKRIFIFGYFILFFIKEVYIAVKLKQFLSICINMKIFNGTFDVKRKIQSLLRINLNLVEKKFLKNSLKRLTFSCSGT